ncbi:MAG: 4Fe-4S dicluster domain-containing protein [Candidatus Bathyarchaeia archaeon]|jgi:succinate dehydrogenase/fumarate reductase-like Fe-S protein
MDVEKSNSNLAVYVFGKQYHVPENLTILTAMESLGYRLLRGCGCRSGFCGACATVYRIQGDYRLRTGLACQTPVKDGMVFSMLPFHPATKAKYNLKELPADLSSIVRFYPEVMRCLQCNTCSRACPQELPVIDVMGAVMRGDISTAADLSFDCIMCGLCATRCPAEIVQYYVAILARRLYAAHLAPKSKHLQERLQQVRSGFFDEDLDHLTHLSTAELAKMYNAREIEKEAA